MTVHLGRPPQRTHIFQSAVRLTTLEERIHEAVSTRLLARQKLESACETRTHLGAGRGPGTPLLRWGPRCPV